MLNRGWIGGAALILTWSMSLGAQSSEPLQHVEKARGLLAEVSDKSLKRNARERVDELRKLFDEMAKAYPNSSDWRTKFSAVESQLTRIIGGGRGPGLEAATTGAGGAATSIGSGAGLGNQVGSSSSGQSPVLAAGSPATGGTGTSAGATATGGAPTSDGGGTTGGTSTTGGAIPSGATTATGAATTSGTATTGGQAAGGGTGATGGATGAPGAGTVTAASSGTSGGAQAGDIGPTGSGAVGVGQSSAVGAGAGIAVVGEIGMKDLDPAVREQLRAFRLEVELFFASALTDNLGVTNRTERE